MAAKLLSALDDMLSPLSVFKMAADQVDCIAGESEETRTERDQSLVRGVGASFPG